MRRLPYCLAAACFVLAARTVAQQGGSSPGSPDATPLVRCASAGHAFAAAWLAPAPLFLATRFPDEPAGEPASYDMFERTRAARKTRNATVFWVEHLSGLEHHVELAPPALQRQGGELVEQRAREAEESACLTPRLGVKLPALALVPYWRGYGGAAHSSSSLHVRERHLRATACAAAATFGSVAIGACVDVAHGESNATDAAALAALQLPGGALRVNVTCGGSGTRLMFGLLRHAQARMRAPGSGWLGWRAAYVFYTEGDQVVRVDPPGALRALAGDGALSGAAYLAPNRLEELYEGVYGVHRGPAVAVGNRTFALVNRCDDASGDAERTHLGCGAAVRRSRARARGRGCRRLLGLTSDTGGTRIT